MITKAMITKEKWHDNKNNYKGDNMITEITAW